MSAAPAPPAAVTALALAGVPEVTAGDDLAALVVAALRATGEQLAAGDVLVVASKVVAKAEGRAVAAPDAAAREAAIASQTLRVVAERLLPDGRTTRVVHSRSGPVLAAAGVDASDVPDGTVLLLPADPDASARALRARLAELTGTAPGVLITDTGGRPWRDGVADFALGAAGFAVLDDVRGRRDTRGRVLEVTVRAVADEVAALADLVKGKSAGTPVALVRGLGAAVVDEDGPGAGVLVRTGPADWFAHGHVEAVRAALGLAPGALPPPPIGVGDGSAPDVAARVERALAVALAGGAPAGAGAVAVGNRLVVSGPPFAAGALAERLRVALWAESLAASVEETATGALVGVSARP